MNTIADFDQLIYQLKEQGLVTDVISRASKTFFSTLDGTRHGFYFDRHREEFGVSIEEKITLNVMRPSQSFGTLFPNQSVSDLQRLVINYNKVAE